MKILNVIDFINWFGIPGLGELIIILIIAGAFIEGCLLIIPFMLTRGILIHYLWAKTRNRLYVTFYTTDGLKKYFTLPLGTCSYRYKDPEGIESVWSIARQGIEWEPNGVRSTIIHPKIPHNITGDQLAKYYANGNEGTLSDPQEQAKFIDNLANHDAELANSGEKLQNIIMGIGFLIGIGILVYLVLYAVGQLNFCSSAAESVHNLGTTTTTTTIPIGK